MTDLFGRLTTVPTDFLCSVGIMVAPGTGPGTGQTVAISYI